MGRFQEACKVGIIHASATTYDRSRVQSDVTSALGLLGMPLDGDANRGPLRSIVGCGDTVLLKPNMIRQSHLLNDDWDYIITHGEVVRAVALLVAQALNGRGRLVIADGPQTDSDFDAVASLMGLDEIAAEVRETHGIRVDILDLREERWIIQDGITIRRDPLEGDPAGYVEFDLGEDSMFADHNACDRLYGADYDVSVTRRAHTGGRHVYRMAATPIEADVFINIPKMKTHKKTGVTLSLKNLVGIHGNRNYLPHFTVGTRTGGDESPGGSAIERVGSVLTQWMKDRLTKQGGVGGRWLRLVKRAGYRTLGDTEAVVRSGNWYGNDTTWRMVVDLNRLLFFGRPDGTIGDTPRKKYLTIIDGIMAGEGNGPMAPDPYPAGLIVAGLNPVATDIVCSALMGFDPARLKMLTGALRASALPIADFDMDQVVCRSNVAEWCGSFDELMAAPHLGFKPHFGWVGHIEREPTRGIWRDSDVPVL